MTEFEAQGLQTGPTTERTDVEITEHFEPPRQGGARYWRCETCGAESVMGADAILHDRGCPASERGR